MKFIFVVAGGTSGPPSNPYKGDPPIIEKIRVEADDVEKARRMAGGDFRKRHPGEVVRWIEIAEHSPNPTPRIPRGKAASKPSQAPGHAAPSERLVKRRRKTAAQPMPGIWANPLTRVKVNDPPSRGGFEMDDRLMARRKLTNKKSTPKGFYANPVDDDELRDSTSYSTKATKANIVQRAQTLASAIKAPAGRAPGALSLDISNGGYRLMQFVRTGGQKNLSGRLSGTEMLMFLDGAILVARACK